MAGKEERSKIRAAAEKKFFAGGKKEPRQQTETDQQKNIQELQIHQIELEMQQEELGRDRDEIKLKGEKSQKENALLNAVSNSLKDTLIFALDMDYRYLFFNNNHRLEMKKIYGADIELGRSMLDYISTAEVRTLAKASYDRALKGESFSEVNGQPLTEIWYELNWGPLKSADGSNLGLYCLVKDVSEHHRLDGEVKRLASFPELNPMPVVEIDNKGGLTYANPAAQKDFPDLENKQGNHPFLAALNSYFTELGQVVNKYASREIKLGNEWYSQVISLVSPQFLRIYAINITESKRMKAELDESLAKYRTLFETMSEGVALHQLLYDSLGKPADYIILEVNPSYGAMTGLEPVKAIGRKASELYGTGQPPYLDIYARVVATGQPEQFETIFSPMGKTFSISVFSPGKGQFATVFMDITGRKQAEESMSAKVKELEKITKIMEGREDKIIELKQRIKELEARVK
jgi:PAS domain-containing protein